MRDVVYKVTSCLSVILTLFLIYDLIRELREDMSILDIDFLPFLITLIVVANGVLAFLLLIGKIKPQKHLLIFQILVIIPTCLLLYQIFFNSRVSCT